MFGGDIKGPGLAGEYLDQRWGEFERRANLQHKLNSEDE